MYLVIGSGIAGLAAALRIAAVRGADQVMLVTKGDVTDSNTRYAQGGIAAAVGADDSPRLHAEDTIAVGCGLNVADVVSTVCAQGADLVRDLEQLVPFDLNPDGTPALGLEAAHRRHRVLHAGGDATGRAVALALIGKLQATGVNILEHTVVTDLLTRSADSGRPKVCGARVFDARTGVAKDIAATAVLLATGGLGQVYAYTTNPSVATGDGIALAWRAGATLADMEFVQFHPTSLNWEQHFLISEAVRGEGAVLLDHAGVRFMQQVHPLAELAPRDVVARGIKRAMERGEVTLDARALADTLADRFPTIDATLHRAGFDWQHEPVPVSPAAHYMMGGVAADLDGRTSLAGLFAAGEVASTGFHGANRLASNSLLEGLVMGTRAADVMVQGATAPLAITSNVADIDGAVDGAADGAADADVTGAEFVEAPDALVSIRARLRNVMWEEAGIMRTREGLEHARDTLRSLGDALPIVAPVDPAQQADRAEVRNMLTVGELIVEAALRRPESRGSHARLDFTNTVPELAERHYLRNLSAATRPDQQSLNQGDLAVLAHPADPADRRTRQEPVESLAERPWIDELLGPDIGDTSRPHDVPVSGDGGLIPSAVQTLVNAPAGATVAENEGAK